MSRRGSAHRQTAVAVALVATLSLVSMDGHAAGPSSGSKQYRMIEPADPAAENGPSAPALTLRGYNQMALVARISPWQKRINLETAWLLSPYLIERRKKSRWSTLYA